MTTPVARAARGPPAVRSAAGEGIDEDVVDRPVATGILRVEHQLPLEGRVAVPDAEPRRERERLRRVPAGVTGAVGADDGLVGHAVLRPAHLDVQHAPRAARAACEEAE